MQTNESDFLHRALLIVEGAAHKEGVLPPGTLAHLAERCLSACAARASTHFQPLCKAVNLVVRHP